MTDDERERERLRLTEMVFRPEEIERHFDPAISDATKAAESNKVMMRFFQPVLDTRAKRREARAVGRRIFEQVAAQFFPAYGEVLRRRRRRRTLSIGITVALLLAGLAALLLLRLAQYSALTSFHA